jgi:hypothetical protein
MLRIFPTAVDSGVPHGGDSSLQLTQCEYLFFEHSEWETLSLLEGVVRMEEIHSSWSMLSYVTIVRGPRIAEVS